MGALRDKFGILLMPYKPGLSNPNSNVDTSRWMSPLKLFESLASGTPILCSNIKVLREILKNEHNSLLINNFENKNEWIKKIKGISISFFYFSGKSFKNHS